MKTGQRNLVAARLGWLRAVCARKVARLHALRRAGAEAAQDEALSPERFRKLRCWMRQVRRCRTQERALLWEIEQVEQRHRWLKAQKKLRRADATRTPKPEDFDAPYAEKPERGLFWVVMAVWALTPERRRAMMPGFRA